MAAYASAAGGVEMGDVERTVVLVEKKSSVGRLWKGCLALLAVAVCFGGVMLFAWQFSRKSDITAKTEALIEEDTAEKTGHNRMLRRISSKAKAAIHLEGNNDESEQQQLEWRSDRDQAFAQGGFRLQENQIVVPQTGLYFVYSQASFRVSCGDGDSAEERAEKRLTPLSHKIWRFSDSLGTKASLMSAVRSACQTSAQDDGYRDGHSWYNAIYLGAVFQLNRGDRLWTETNQVSELETGKGQTFFGVFAL